MRIDSSFQPDEDCIAFTVAHGGAWRTDFANTGKEATQHPHLRGAAIGTLR
jgi:hypothetical protein